MLDRKDFPLTVSGHSVFKRTDAIPICTCTEESTAHEIAKRLNAMQKVQLYIALAIIFGAGLGIFSNYLQ